MPEEEEEEGFSFVDKRRVTSEDEAVQSAASPIESSEAATLGESEETSEGTFDENEVPGMGLPQLNVRDRILMSIDILHQGAWIAMGLRADPATGEVAADLEGARAAIDCVAFLASKVESSLDEATQRELKRIVSDLQINYVNQARRAQGS